MFILVSTPTECGDCKTPLRKGDYADWHQSTGIFCMACQKASDGLILSDAQRALLQEFNLRPLSQDRPLGAAIDFFGKDLVEDMAKAGLLHIDRNMDTVNATIIGAVSLAKAKTAKKKPVPAAEGRRIVFCLEASPFAEVHTFQQVAVLQAISQLGPEDRVGVLGYSNRAFRMVGVGDVPVSPTDALAQLLGKALPKAGAHDVPDMVPACESAQKYFGDEGGDIILLTSRTIGKVEANEAKACLGRGTQIHVVRLEDDDLSVEDSKNWAPDLTRSCKNGSYQDLNRHRLHELGTVLFNLSQNITTPPKQLRPGDKVLVNLVNDRAPQRGATIVTIAGNMAKVRLEYTVSLEDLTPA